MAIAVPSLTHSIPSAPPPPPPETNRSSLAAAGEFCCNNKTEPNLSSLSRPLVRLVRSHPGIWIQALQGKSKRRMCIVR